MNKATADGCEKRFFDNRLLRLRFVVVRGDDEIEDMKSDVPKSLSQDFERRLQYLVSNA